MTTPLFLLPGLLCDEHVWAPQVAALSDRAEIFISSFYGFDSLGAMAASVLARAPARFSLAGHSMGGRVAFEIFRQAPERVERLALLDTGAHGVQPGEAEQRQVLMDVARIEGMLALGKAWLPPMLHPDRVSDQSLMAPLMAMICRATPDIYFGQIRALLNRPDAALLLSQIRVPTAFIVGRQDSWSPVSQHETLAASVRGATLTIIEACGHMSTVERPREVTRALADWLARAPTA